jgi:multisubunit Na+/H+ antiporter MnhG subunit
MIVRDYYTRTMAFKKARSAYELALIFGILFWMPMIVLAFMYFFVD